MAIARKEFTSRSGIPSPLRKLENDFSARKRPWARLLSLNFMGGSSLIEKFGRAWLAPPLRCWPHPPMLPVPAPKFIVDASGDHLDVAVVEGELIARKRAAASR